MMDYIYGNDDKGAIRRNWQRVGIISPGDWFVAYLPPSMFYAFGRVITPRRPKTVHDHADTIDNYLTQQRSHDHHSGCVYYTPVFYEEFEDNWRHPKNKTLWPQRVDVDEWRDYVAKGVSVTGLSKLSPLENRLSVTKITKSDFDRIAKKLAAAHGSVPKRQGAGGVEDSGDDAVVEALEKTHAKSQGFQLDSKLRKALEDYAMDAAKRHFTSLGYDVEDHSKNHPYDLRCVKKNEWLCVEVKGTQTNGEGVFLTSGEVEFARQHKGHMALFLLHSIKVSENKKVLTNGQSHVLLPWDVDKGCLKAMSYQYGVPGR